MLYLEDYLEMIEHLPQELRDRFTEMREMDLSVQNNVDSLDKRVRTLFQQCRRGELVGSQADSEFYNIRKDYYRVLEDSDEKVQLAGQMYDLVDRYLRRLDSELYKFKCELEADHNGITEILEKRSLELDSSSTNGGINQKENRYFETLTGMGGGLGVSSSAARVESRYKIKPEKRRESSAVSGSLGGPPPEKRQAIAAAVAASNAIVSGTPVRPTTPSVAAAAAAASEPYHNMLTGTTSVPPRAASLLQQFGAGSAIAAAASQAIAQTQQMQQGRRTASFKASSEAMAGGAGAGPHNLLINRELAGATHNALQAVERETNNAFSNQQRRQQKKKMTTASSSSAADLLEPSGGLLAGVAAGGSVASSSIISAGPPSGSGSSHHPPGSGGSIGPLLGTGAMLNENGMVVEQTPEGEWTYDPNEPRYCICNQVSYGDMVACDNEDCPFEWFHYPCVNITSSPKGKWYCPQCSSSMKRRGASRKN